MTLPGASRFPPRPFAPPPAPPRAPAPAALQPRLDAAIDGGVGVVANGAQGARRAPGCGDAGRGARQAGFARRGDARRRRRAADALIRAAHAQAQELFPSAAAEVFGSFPTNAWVPGASNVDVALALPDAVASAPRLKMEALRGARRGAAPKRLGRKRHRRAQRAAAAHLRQHAHVTLSFWKYNSESGVEARGRVS